MTPQKRFSARFVFGFILIGLFLSASIIQFVTQSSAQVSSAEDMSAAQEFYLAKRASDGKADAFEQRYLNAQRQRCGMVRYLTAQDQSLPSLAQMPAQAGSLTPTGWTGLGPEETNAFASRLSDAGNPCASDTAWILPQFDSGDSFFTHGQVYASGRKIIASTLGRGLRQANINGEQTTWRAVSAEASGHVAVDPNDSNTLYVASRGLGIRKSADGGRSFNNASNGLADEGLFVPPLSLDPNDGQRLWTGGRAIWRTIDGGANWRRASAPIAGGATAKISALAVAPSNGGYVLAGTNEGHILRTYDGFNTAANDEWAVVQPRVGFVSSLTFNPINPDLAYATYSSFGGAHIWRSFDAGASWKSIDGEGETVLPDVPVHALVVDPTNSSRLFVGTDLGLFVSLDGGANWMVEGADFGAAVVESLAVGSVEGTPALFAFTHGKGVWRISLAPNQCSYTISPTSRTYEAAGGTGTVNVTTTAACNWTANSNVAWVTINSGATGTGLGTVNFTVAANTGAASRTGTLTIAGATFTVEQAGVNGTCLPVPISNGQTLSGALVNGDCFSRRRTSSFADRYTFTARSGELVAITLSASIDTYLYLFGPEGQLVAENDQGGTASSRIPASSGFLTLAAAGTYTIEVTTFSGAVTGTYSLNLNLVPPGCGSFGILPTTRAFDASGGVGSLQVATGSNCPWTATNNLSWVAITSGSGAGSVPVNFTVAPNVGAFRRGTLTIAGNTFTVEQAGAGGKCSPIPISAGQTVNGVLSTADCRLRPGDDSLYVNRYSFTALAGQQVILSASNTDPASSSFVPFLYLENADGVVLRQGQARVPASSGTFAIPADGTYLIEVSSNFLNGTGAYSLTLAVLPPGCGYSVSPSLQSFEAIGGTGSVRVAASVDCPWTATTNADWITINSGATGAGNGLVNFTVAPNSGNSYRSATLAIGGQAVTVEQAGASGRCSVQSIAPGESVSSLLNDADCRSRLRAASFQGAVYYAERYSFAGLAGQQVQVVVKPSVFTPHVYLTDANGLVLADGTTPTPGTGFFVLPANGTYYIEVTSESSGGAGGYTLSFNAAPAGCAYVTSPPWLAFDSSGGVGSVNVTAAPGCNWSVAFNASWIIPAPGGRFSGNGILAFAVAPNNSTVLRRAVLTVAGQVVTVDQAGAGGNCLPVPIIAGQSATGTLNGADCRSSLTSTQGYFADWYSFTALAGDQIAVSASAASFTPFLYLLDANNRTVASGSGRAPANGVFTAPANGTYLIEVASNFSSGNGDYTLSLGVLPGNCTYSLTPASQTFEAAGGAGSVAVSAPDGCAWRASSNASWLTISSGANGAGNGTLSFAVAANTFTSMRTGAINIGTRAFTVTQAGAGGSCAVTPIAIGNTINGDISGAECVSQYRTGGTYYADRYSFNFSAGQQFALTATGSTLTPYLYLTDANGMLLAQGGGRGVRLPAGNDFFTFPASGTYFLEVTTESSGNVSGYTLQLLTPSGCANSFLPARQTFEVAGGTGSVNLVTGSACAWTAASNATWLTITSGANGTGSGAINFTVAANTSGALRSAMISAGAQNFLVEQAGAGGSCSVLPIAPNQPLNAGLSTADCRSRLSTSSSPPYADRYSFTANAGDQVLVMISSSSQFFSQSLALIDPRGVIIAQVSGLQLPSGNAFLTLPLSGAYTIEFSSSVTGAYAITLFNVLAGCSYALSPDRQTFEAASSEGSFSISASNNCSWVAVPNVNWITVTTSAGSGNGVVRFTVSANISTISRSGALLAGGRSFTVEQAGTSGSCNIAPLADGQLVSGSLTDGDCLARAVTGSQRADRYSFSGLAGNSILLQAFAAFTPSLALIAPDGSVVMRLDGLRLPATGSLALPVSGTYLIEIAASTSSGSDRSYQLAFASVAGGCGFSLATSGQRFESTGGQGSADVTAGSGCAWTAATSATWITINSGASGAGNGKVSFTVAPNTGTNSRSTRLLIAGRSFLVEQAGAGGSCTPLPLTVEQTVAGTLNQSDCNSPTKTTSVYYADRYSFAAAAGQQVSIAAAAPNSFSPELYLYNSNGLLVAQVTGSSSNLTARIPAGSGFLTLPGAGNYVLELTSNSSSSSGAYTLSVNLVTAGCAYAVSPTSQTLDPASQTGSFNVVAGGGCAWAAASNASWITITPTAGGSGNGVVNYAVAANTTTSSRTGTISLAGNTFTIEQAGVGGTCVAAKITPGQAVTGTINTGDCASRVRTDSSSSIRADRYTFSAMAGDRVSVVVTSQLSSPVLALLNPAGAVVSQTTGARLPSSGVIILPATGLYTIELSAFTTGNYSLALNLQTACTFAVSPATLEFESAGGTGSISVNAAAGCDWLTVNNNRDWLSIALDGNFGSDAGVVKFNVTANIGAISRIGTLTVAGQTITIKQAGRVALANAASFVPDEIAPGSIVAAFGQGFVTFPAAVSTSDLPTALAGVTVKVRDSAGVTRDAGLLSLAPEQINFVVPAEVAFGDATVIVSSDSGTVATGTVRIAAVAPGLFTINADGRGLPSGVALRIRNGVQTFEPIARFEPMLNRFVAVPIDLGPAGDEIYLILFGTGFRGRSTLSATTVLAGGVTVAVQYAGPQGGFAGLDQLNLLLPRALAGRGDVNFALTVDGKNANVVQINIR